LARKALAALATVENQAPFRSGPRLDRVVGERKRSMKTRAIPFLFAVWLVAGCATSPLGRSQLVLFPEGEMASMGVAAFNKVKQETPQVDDPAVVAYVRCVAQAVTREAAGPKAPSTWDVVVFREPSANAFALPGGKIGVHSGLLDVARTPDQLAAVIGHEIAHVLSDHSNERVSTAFATESGLQLAAALSGAAASPTQRQLFGLLGLGAQVGVLLPFSRTQEREADLIGVDLMARAGFDPRESIALWKNMAASGGAWPPEFLSTHPGYETRMRDLQERLPHAMPLYEQARAAGRRPSCAR
jgi:predicted Zn-dependent protease